MGRRSLLATADGLSFGDDDWDVIGCGWEGGDEGEWERGGQRVERGESTVRVHLVVTHGESCDPLLLSWISPSLSLWRTQLNLSSLPQCWCCCCEGKEMKWGRRRLAGDWVEISLNGQTLPPTTVYRSPQFNHLFRVGRQHCAPLVLSTLYVHSENWDSDFWETHRVVLRIIEFCSAKLEAISRFPAFLESYFLGNLSSLYLFRNNFRWADTFALINTKVCDHIIIYNLFHLFVFVLRVLDCAS